MAARVQCHRLQVSPVLHRFIEDRVLPGIGINSADFWKGFDAIVHDLTPINRALLAERDRIQLEMDAWHRANPGPVTDMPAYRRHLESIGYLKPRPHRLPPPPPTWMPSLPCRQDRSWLFPS